MSQAPPVLLDSLLREFQCKICLSTCIDAVESTCCNNLFCYPCLNVPLGKVRTCPCCRHGHGAEDFSFAPNVPVRRMIDEHLEVECAHCSAAMKNGARLSHERECGERVVPCVYSFRGCRHLARRRDFPPAEGATPGSSSSASPPPKRRRADPASAPSDPGASVPRDLSRLSDHERSCPLACHNLRVLVDPAAARLSTYTEELRRRFRRRVAARSSVSPRDLMEELDDAAVYFLAADARELVELHRSRHGRTLRDADFSYQHVLLCRVIDLWNVDAELFPMVYYHRGHPSSEIRVRVDCEFLALRAEDVELPSGGLAGPMGSRNAVYCGFDGLPSGGEQVD